MDGQGTDRPAELELARGLLKMGGWSNRPAREAARKITHFMLGGVVASMIGQKLLIVEPLRVDEKDANRLKPTGRTFVVVDTVGAGEGEVVLCVQGSSGLHGSILHVLRAGTAQPPHSGMVG